MQQLPLTITIHKSQGITLNKAWIDVGRSESFDGLSYVALSRVRNMSDLIIEPSTFKRLLSARNKKAFEFRVAEEKHL